MADVTGPRDLFDDPDRYASTLAGFGARAIVQVLTFHALLSAIGLGLCWLLPDTRPPHATSPWSVVLAWAVQPPVIILAAGAFANRRREQFWWLHGGMTLTFVAWLSLLVWNSPGFFAAVLAALFVVWGYHDAWTAGGAKVRGTYLAAGPTGLGALLLLDLVGERGLAWSWTHERPAALAVLVVMALLLACVQWLIRWVDGEVSDRDRRAAERAAMESRLLALEREREVVQVSCELLTTGLVASKFSHDLASPLTVVRLDIEALTALVDRFDPGPAQAELRELVDELATVSAQVSEMTAHMARAVRSDDTPTPEEVRAWCRDAVAGLPAALRGQRVPPPPVEVDVEDARVLLARGHVGTLANLLVNSALAAPDKPIRITGRRAGGRYRLTVHDQGVTGAERDAALRRIDDLIHLRTSATPPGQRGLGVALLLARTYLVRHGGGLRVGAAAAGPGLEFELDVPLEEVLP